MGFFGFGKKGPESMPVPEAEDKQEDRKKTKKRNWKKAAVFAAALGTAIPAQKIFSQEKPVGVENLKETDAEKKELIAEVERLIEERDAVGLEDMDKYPDI